MILQKPAFLLWQLWRSFKDLWVSRKADGTITIEQMDGKICNFKFQNGDIQFGTGSFAEIDPEIKDQITARYEELIGSL